MMVEKGFPAYTAPGFTLLEVMVAIAILAVALVTLLGSQGNSVSAVDEGRFYFVSSLLADRKLLTSVDGNSFLLTEEGNFGADYPNYRWHRTVSSPDFSSRRYLAGADQFLQRIEVVVEHENGGKSYTVVRYRLTGYDD